MSNIFGFFCAALFNEKLSLVERLHYFSVNFYLYCHSQKECQLSFSFETSMNFVFMENVQPGLTGKPWLCLQFCKTPKTYRYRTYRKLLFRFTQIMITGLDNQWIKTYFFASSFHKRPQNTFSILYELEANHRLIAMLKIASHNYLYSGTQYSGASLVKQQSTNQLTEEC